MGRAMPNKLREIWFYRMTIWSASYYWPRHWKGRIIMVAAIASSLGSFFLALGIADGSSHPELEWLSLLAAGAPYLVFDIIAKRHSHP